MRASRMIAAGILAAAFSQSAFAVSTDITVRVMAKDAKFVGTETGGAKVTLRDADTGEILAEGLTAGTTGNTPKIMGDGRLRRDALSDDKTAKFTATLDLQRPRRITVTATGPMALKDAALTATSTQWVLPGKPVNGGDGWVLELPGFAITLADPIPGTVALNGKETKIPLKAKITMQCGCPITPGGMWDASKFEIAAMLEKGGKTLPAAPLSYTGQPSTFQGDIAVSAPGDYTIDLYAYDPATGNTGLVKVPVIVR
jgi:hypothetical protein